jgi:hypothetical protein
MLLLPAQHLSGNPENAIDTITAAKLKQLIFYVSITANFTLTMRF